VRGAELLVVVPEEPLVAVLLLLFQPAIIKKPISSSTATPAIQPHIPPVPSSRRTTGSLNRGSGSFNRGSVKRGSVMTSSLFGTLRVVSNKGNPSAIAPVPNKQPCVRGTCTIRLREPRVARHPRRQERNTQEIRANWQPWTKFRRSGQRSTRGSRRSGRKPRKTGSISWRRAPNAPARASHRLRARIGPHPARGDKACPQKKWYRRAARLNCLHPAGYPC
jgi:hypothetical protein